MMRIYRATLVLWCFFLWSPFTRAVEPVQLARTPDISPDGKRIAFSYLGDIWVVESIGGTARPVTMHQAHDIYPVFSPDGKQLAFASNRHGSYDVYVVSVDGGRPRRLTYDSAMDLPTGWSPDGKSILFASMRSAGFPSGYDLYTVPVDGGAERRITTTEARDGVFSPKGDRIAYVRGPGTWYRKGYRGSSNDDLWVCAANGSNHVRLTTFEGQDTSPMWSADGSRIYYVSEGFGTPANLVSIDSSGKGKPVLLTRDKAGKPFHTSDGVRRARISSNGQQIVYECGADLWVMEAKEGATPRRVVIEVHADDKANPDSTTTFTNRATQYALSYDEKHIAFVVHGELFLMPVGPRGVPRRLTNHPANDHGMAWAPDSSKMVFLSDRGGYEDLYLLEANDPEHPKFVDAHEFKVKQLTNTRDPESGVTFSPDGKRVSYLSGGKLWTMNPDGSDQKIVINTPQVIDYEWSPDSKWIVFARMDGSFASELYIMPAAGGNAVNVTRFATFNAGVTWSQDGKKLAFLSMRQGKDSSLYVLSLEKPAAPGVPARKDLTIDWEDIHLRVNQPSSMAVREGAISSDGNTVAFVATSEGSTDLWVANASGGRVTRLTTGNIRPQQVQWSRRNPTALFFRDGNGQLHIARLTISTSGISGTTAMIPFKAKMTVVRDDLYTEMFDQAWRSLSDNFYDDKFHGADWEAVRKKYRPLVKHVAQKEDLYSLLYLMMGELNASHLGVNGFTSAPDETTAYLGFLFDDTYTGRGLKVAEILRRGPADKRGFNLKPGEYILAIDEVELTPKVNVSKLLNDKVGETVVLLVAAKPDVNLKDPKAVRRLETQTISYSQISRLMYERWVENNARRVHELSQGKLGYIHIPSMDEAGLERFVRSLYSDNYDKEAIVLDVRFNGGGFTHDQVLNYLGSKQHTFFRQRYGGEGAVLRSYDRKWTKPVTLLINNRSYSDAEIFPNAFRALGLGKLVGQATGGYVIGTTSTQLIDGSVLRLPRTGVYTLKGVNMDKQGVNPDVSVEITPEHLARGQDPQLDKAVEVLQVDLANWKKAQGNLTSRNEQPKK